MAHSMTVTPFLNASSLTSLSLVSSVSRATARRCSFLVIPKLARTGMIWRSEGTQEERILSKDVVDVDLMLLMVDPDVWVG